MSATKYAAYACGGVVTQRTNCRMAPEPVSLSMVWYCSKCFAMKRGNASAMRITSLADFPFSLRARLAPQQAERDQRGQAERGRDDQNAASHRIDQKAERQRGGGLGHPRRCPDKAEAIAVIHRAEDRQRQGAA